MTESDYFAELEFRVCRELEGMREAKLCAIWCDGFIPEELEIQDNRGRVTGRVWLGFGPRNQECWDFSLLLAPGMSIRDQIDWTKLVIAEDVTGWLSLNFRTKFMKLDPCVARPDLSPMARTSVDSDGSRR